MLSSAFRQSSTAAVTTVKGQGSVLSNAASALASTSCKIRRVHQCANSGRSAGAAGASVTSPPGPALGSIDQSLALVTECSNGTNTS